jgi:hypothetical protein
MAEPIQWDHRVETVGSALSGIKDIDLKAVLDAWSQEGWEVISVSSVTKSNKLRLVARRPLTPTEERRRRRWPEI